MDKQPPQLHFYLAMAKKGFQAIALQGELASKIAGKTPTKQSAAKEAKSAKVQRAIYFPADIDEALQQLAFDEKTKVTPLVVEGVRLLLADRGIKQ